VVRLGQAEKNYFHVAPSPTPYNWMNQEMQPIAPIMGGQIVNISPKIA
jgi:hypothetical protein